MALLLVKFLLPATPGAYLDVATFLAGVRDTWSSASEEAIYTTAQYLGGSWPVYALNTYLASLTVLAWYVYASSLYAPLSLLAAALAHRHYRLYALGAYAVALGVFCWRFVHVYDAGNLYRGGALFAAGAVIVLVSAGIGLRLSGKTPDARPSTGRVRLDFSQ